MNVGIAHRNNLYVFMGALVFVCAMLSLLAMAGK